MANPLLDARITEALLRHGLQTDEEVGEFAGQLLAYQIIQTMTMDQLLDYVRSRVAEFRSANTRW